MYDVGIHNVIAIDSTLYILLSSGTLCITSSWDHNWSCEGCWPCIYRDSWQDPTVPMWHVGTEATDILPDLISLGVMGEKFDPAATKSVILLLFYSLMWPPWKQFIGRCLLNGLAWQTTAKWGNQVVKDPMVKLKIGPTSRKGCHRDACVVLDATDTCVSTHHFIPGL